MSERWQKAALAMFALATVTVLAFVWREQLECSAKGGERMRPLWGTFKCYDRASLRELK